MNGPKPAPQSVPGAYSERHYSPAELASLWGVSLDTIRRLFRNEPGVLVFCNKKLGKRTYRTLRIPASVAERVHRKLSIARNDSKLYNSRCMSTFR